MNDLEQWLADVRAFNESVSSFRTAAWAPLVSRQIALEQAGRALGLKRSKIKSMLARVRLKVEMPEESKSE